MQLVNGVEVDGSFKKMSVIKPSWLLNKHVKGLPTYHPNVRH